MKEPQSISKEPPSVWNKNVLDYFGPLPTEKHILVAQDILTRYPAAKIVSSTNLYKVILALNDIYMNYG